MNDKRVKRANIIAWISFIIILLLVVATLFIKNEKVSLLTISVMMIFILILISSSYFVYKDKYKGDTQSVMIPRIYGIGWSVNPNSKLGKAIWILIALFIIVLMLIELSLAIL